MKTPEEFFKDQVFIAEFDFDKKKPYLKKKDVLKLMADYAEYVLEHAYVMRKNPQRALFESELEDRNVYPQNLSENKQK